MDANIQITFIILIHLFFTGFSKRFDVKEATFKLKKFAQVVNDKSKLCNFINPSVSSAAPQQCTLPNKSSESMTLGKQPAYKECAMRCLLTKGPKTPNVSRDFQPVFDNDVRKEFINCNLRERSVSPECKNSINMGLLNKFGTSLAFFVQEKLSWFDAQKRCNSMGLTLVTLETAGKIQNLGYFLKRIGKSGMFSLWTSGSSLLKNATHPYFWYDTFAPLGPEISITEKLESGQNYSCVAITVVTDRTNVEWTKESCKTARFSFVCEIPKLCFYEKCKNKARLKSGLVSLPLVSEPCSPKKCRPCPAKKPKTIEVNEKTGRYFKVNGKQYFRSHDRRGADDAISICCGLGMKLWSPSTAEELDLVFDELERIGYDLNFTAIHVDARDENCNEQFMICDTKEFVSADFKWLPAQPDDWTVNEMCLIYTVVAGVRGLVDTTCHYKYYFVCKADENNPTVDKQISTEVKRFKPHCFKTLAECNPSVMCNPGAPVNPPLSSGRLFEGCGGKKYFFGNDSKTPDQAGQFCCKIGMHLAVLETWEEVHCVRDLTKNYTIFEMRFNMLWYVSGYEDKCDGTTPKYCATGKPVLNDYPWLPGEPDNKMAPEKCFALALSPFVSGITDFGCIFGRSFICESF
ncbi:uncharacterized protein LOC132194023 [Neocloeon triangulifer]|uniref:uncharacterized protein LOC132194023 n=1 Tax=Neocloeon triangulifer TaxID=2078957 RepID=UPI00286FAF0C|nr:uncharacterized protein LOC132194023 [Neocloeon triangulifer]